LGLLVAATIVVEGGRSIHDRPAAAPGFAVIQSATMRDLEVGRLRIGAVVETAGPTRATWLFPSAPPEGLDRHRAWLAPHFLDTEGRLLQSVHTFVVKTPDLTVLVDTCIGNDKDRGGRRPFHMLRTGFLDTLRAAGVAPEAVDVVICTHLHVDHVGWNTRLDDGRWVPTFPRARYLFARREWEHWTSEDDDGTRRIMADSVAPVLDAGLAELVSMDHQVADEIRLEPTPGHTPGHVSVRLASRGADAVITGDLMHHPVQIAEPAWQTTFDTDPAKARETRRAFCARYADRPVTVLGTHFHHPTAGRIVSHRDAWRFAVEGTT
jgi:glyoxylase-like metal-dependent hydrolase (beta-lactamase superfamily II)